MFLSEELNELNDINFSVTEGVVLQKDGVNPYTGDMFHESPVGLAIYSQLIEYASPYLPGIFILLDLITGHLLYLTAVEYMKHLVSYLILIETGLGLVNLTF